MGRNGKIYSFGKNNYGQLGFGDKIYLSSPKKICELIDIVKIYCNNNSSCCIDSNGSVWVFGDNTHCNLGFCNIKYNEIISPIKNDKLYEILDICMFHVLTFFKTSYGDIFVCGCNIYDIIANITKYENLDIYFLNDQVKSCNLDHIPYNDDKISKYNAIHDPIYVINGSDIWSTLKNKQKSAISSEGVKL